MDCEHIKQTMPRMTVVKLLYKWPVSSFSGNVFKKQLYLRLVSNKHFCIVVTWESQDENSCINIF